MSCDICGRGSCTQSFHSLWEQERYEKVIELFEQARSLRDELRDMDAPEEESDGASDVRCSSPGVNDNG